MKRYMIDLTFVWILASLLVLGMFGLTKLVVGAPPTIYRDRVGRMIGTSTTSGRTTTYRDRVGRQVGSATTSGNNTTYRDRVGRVIIQQSGKPSPLPLLKGKK